MAGRGVDHHSRRFVEDQDAIVFVHDVECDRFGYQLGRLRIRDVDFDLLPTGESGARTSCLETVHPDSPVCDPALCLGAADAEPGAG
jgi:hypothetical protein